MAAAVKPFAPSIEAGDDCITIRHEAGKAKTWEQWYLIRFDAHRDHPCTDKAMERRHLQDARARGAGIIDGGDLFDAMQGVHDPRRSYDELAPEVAQEDYYDAVVKAAARSYEPYAKHWVLLARGNHETSVRKHAGTDLTERLATKFREMGSPVIAGGYKGYIRFQFDHMKHRDSRVLYWTHGSGGSAPVTRGVIKATRRATWLNTPDIVVSGHSHEGWLFPIVQEELTDGGRRKHRIQWHLQCPAYKNAHLTRDMGFEAEREFHPQPVGAWWLRFHIARTHDIGMDITFAE